MHLTEFIFNSVVFSWQITDGVKPTLSELEKFEDQPEGLDLEVVTESGDFQTLHGHLAENTIQIYLQGSQQGPVFSYKSKSATVVWYLNDDKGIFVCR